MKVEYKYKDGEESTVYFLDPMSFSKMTTIVCFPSWN